MDFEKITFINADGQELSGRLELPVNKQPHNYVLFAHCFTCTKNFSATKNISRALTNEGFGVLRFDFTGLGDSEGDFENTNFSGNVEDLVCAANWLRDHKQAPTLLVGHSLGGAAVIFAKEQLPSVKAVVTIAAPSNPTHVKNLLKSNIEEIEEQGEATVNLAGRDFKIKKQFLDDLETKSLPQIVSKLNAALLVLHSPQDTTVGIINAEEIYKSAKHPKSFITLDGANHLLMEKEESTYIGKVIAGWSSRYLDIKQETFVVNSTHQVVASLDEESGFTTQLKLGNHYSQADEPKTVGGKDLGPTPYDLVSGGLSACTAMTIQMYAKRKKWHVSNVEVHTSYSRDHAIDCETCEAGDMKIDTFTREIKLEGELDDKQIKRLLQIADKCPVHKTLHSETQVITTLIE